VATYVAGKTTIAIRNWKVVHHSLTLTSARHDEDVRLVTTLRSVDYARNDRCRPGDALVVSPPPHPDTGSRAKRRVRADTVAVPGNPLNDIRVMEECVSS
jgi:hypothetical protein